VITYADVDVPAHGVARQLRLAQDEHFPLD